MVSRNKDLAHMPPHSPAASGRKPRKTNDKVRTMTEFGLISVDQPGAWNDWLTRCRHYDTYHSRGWHSLATLEGEGEPYLFVFAEKAGYAALPFLLRPVADIEGLEECGRRDAASAYGYPGLVTSVGRSDAGAERFRERFQAALQEAMQHLRVVSFFVRQNPLIDSTWLFSPKAKPTERGRTVAIDLRQPEEDQVRKMRANHRRDIRSVCRTGIVVREDPGLERIGTFCGLYRETMDRVGATDYYYFSKEYFSALKKHLGDNVRLLLSEQAGKVLSGAIFLLTGSIIQYHLGGTASDSLHYRGAFKAILDEMRSWGTRNGYAWLHLGGGLKGREDSLFAFKAGFSQTYLPFHTVQIVIEPEVYRE